MTRNAIREYADAVRKRYLLASKTEKRVILDEFCCTTGYNRKSAIRLLRKTTVSCRHHRGRPRYYDLDVVAVLKTVWEAADRICAKRLAPFIPEMLQILERHKQISVSDDLRMRLERLSPASIDRLLKPFRSQGLRRPYSQTSSSPSLKAQIPIRTFGEWADVIVGSLQMDLVLHCGDNTEGFYLTTLVGVDVATGWSEYEPIWGKGQQRVGTGVHHIRQRLPFQLRELHTDNGAEFLNEVLYPWCKREKIKFTRGRAYKKNDQAYVEQKNWSTVRRLIGYDRYCTKEASDQLQRLYGLVRLYVNFFQPIRKLIGKERVGAKVKKTFDRAQTPYQRLLATAVLAEPKRKALEELYLSLNPVQLRIQIDEALEELWKLAERHRQIRPAIIGTKEDGPSR